MEMCDGVMVLFLPIVIAWERNEITNSIFKWSKQIDKGNYDFKIINFNFVCALPITRGCSRRNYSRNYKLKITCQLTKPNVRCTIFITSWIRCTLSLLITEQRSINKTIIILSNVFIKQFVKRNSVPNDFHVSCCFQSCLSIYWMENANSREVTSLISCDYSEIFFLFIRTHSRDKRQPNFVELLLFFWSQSPYYQYQHLEFIMFFGYYLRVPKLQIWSLCSLRFLQTVTNLKNKYSKALKFNFW